MSKDSKIEWTTHTFNPWMGCAKVSEACKHCYAEVATPVRTQRAKGLELWGPPATTARKRTSVANWRQPIAWNADAAARGVRERVFCASLADVFELHPSLDAMRGDLWPIIERTPALDWLLLTKRPGNVRAQVPNRWLHTWPSHVWVGTTVETQARAEERVPALLALPAPVRFVSVEPQLEAIDLKPWLRSHKVCVECGTMNDKSVRWCASCGAQSYFIRCGLEWVITGGESGRGPRPYDLAWARRIVADCKAAGVPVFVKQLGARPVEACAVGCDEPLPDGSPFCGTHHPVGLRDTRHGADPSEWPADLRVREMLRGVSNG